MASRFVAPLASQSSDTFRAILTVAGFIFLAGMLSILFAPALAFSHDTALLFLLTLFIIPFMLTFMLKSFRKAIICCAPNIIALPAVALTAAVMQVQVVGVATLFAPISFGLSCGINYLLAKEYFDQRRKPVPVRHAIKAVYTQYSRAVVGIYLIAAVTFLMIAPIMTGGLSALGIITSISFLYTLLAAIFIMPAAFRLYEHRLAKRALSSGEAAVLKFSRSYGHQRVHHSNFASWLGLSVDEVKQIVDNLKSKGCIGKKFFSLHDPLLWFLTIFSYIVGASIGLGYIPMVETTLRPLFILLLLTVGIALQAPQLIKIIDKVTRRLLGFILVGASLVLAAGHSTLLLQAAIVMMLAGFASIKLSESDIWLPSTILIGVYFALIFALGWAMQASLTDTGKLWSLAFAVIIFAALHIIEEDSVMEIA